MPIDRKAAALKFLGDLQVMDPKDLNNLILTEAGAELAEFFVAYCTSVASQAPERAAETASSLMLMGYLIRCAEDRVKAPAA